jgi:glycosyltransferase involved in cell wall biosynthesis
MSQTAAEAGAMPSPGRRNTIDYVLPIWNESENIDAFHTALVEVTDGRPDIDFEFLYVDDGSTDDSLERLLDLRAKDDRVTVLQLSRNFGHQLAVTAGLEAAAEADAVIVMDTDLQDPPRVSLELITVWEDGADVVYAQRRTRKDTGFKRLSAFVYYWLLQRLASIEIPRNVGDFRLMDKRVVAEVVRYREHSRFLRGIIAHVGFRQEAVLFDRDARHAGETGYPLRKMLSFAVDGVLGFSTVPLQMITRVGFLISFLSLIGAAYVIGVKLFSPASAVPGWAFLGVGVFLLGGLQLIMMGVIGSYLGRVYTEVQNRPLYSLSMVARGRREDGAR